jgi:nitroimidazol reductase NimA-like FMN-containing flavoprotein (pyridoxamine 5'-phosphate oxidase superfamily)
MLPEKAREILRANRQCCLGTVQGDAPYLSLMFYSLLPDEELIVMSSQGDSSKVRNARQNSHAAILVHEAEDLENPVSLTLLGNIEVREGEQARPYQDLHLHNHQERAQFIQGPDIAVLVFIPQRAILADRKGNVSWWEGKKS